MTQRICPVCSGEITHRGKAGPWPTYCSAPCRTRAQYLRRKAAGALPKREPKPLRTATCEQCGEIYETRSGRQKFCSKRCARRAADARATKVCSVDGCARKMTARGMCRTHYNKTRYTSDQRHPKVTVACGYCGEPCQKRKDEKRFKAQFCSYICRDLWRIEQPDDSMHHLREYTAGAARSPRSPRFIRLPADHPVMWCGATCPVAFGACAWCGGMTCRGQRGARAYCSSACRRKAKRCRRRGREAQDFGFWTWFDFMHIARRFNYCCAYCGVKPGEPLQPDHVVPVSKGGANTVANLLPACMACNADKRDLLLDEWAADRERRGLPPRMTAWPDEDRRYFHLTSLPVTPAA